MSDFSNQYLQRKFPNALEEESSLFKKYQYPTPREQMTDSLFQEMLINIIEFREILGDATTVEESTSTLNRSEGIRLTDEEILTENSSRLFNKTLLEKSTSNAPLEMKPESTILSSPSVVFEEQTTIISTSFREKISFTNGNIYEGETENRIMHGRGKFYWSDGTIYEGEFKNGSPHGMGKMIISDLSVYNGQFCNGYFHGDGTYNLVATQLIYSGQWKSGKRHGRGWLQYAPDNWYEGEWVQDLREGAGVRYYKKGCKYKGNWFQNEKHGFGEMLWDNGDYYCGEWKNDKPDGYGEYIWNMVLNDTFTFPCYTFYKGSWLNGLRHGVGLMNFGTECGAQLVGTWMQNEKEGPGLLVCGNGLVIASNPLFVEDKPVTKPKQKTLCGPLQVSPTVEKSLYRTILKLISKKEYIEEFDDNIVQRITDLSTTTTAGRFTELVDPNKETWYCLEIPIHTVAENVDLQYYTDIVVNHYYYQIKLISQRVPTVCESNPEINLQELFKQIRTREKLLLKNLITVYLPQLKEFYHHYARLTTNQTLNFKPILVRLFLWQMLRDVQLFNYTSLVEADLLFSKNPASCAETDHYPFEHIYFWQFIQYLFGCSWLVHLKREYSYSVDVDSLTTGISTHVFKTFLVKDVLPNYLVFQGTALDNDKNMLPVKSLYNLYLYVGEPHTVRTFLHCTVEDQPLCCYKIYNCTEKIQTGINVPIGDKIFYIKEKSDDIVPKPPEPAYSEYIQDPFFRSLYTFKSLGRDTIIKCIVTVCPKVEVGKPGNIEIGYKINFLEFWEILILCAHKKADQKIKAINEELRVRRLVKPKASIIRSSIHSIRESGKRKSRKSLSGFSR